MRPGNLLSTNTLVRPGHAMDTAGVLRPGSYSQQLLSRAITNLQRVAYKYAAAEGDTVSSVDTFKQNGNRFNYFSPKVSIDTETRSFVRAFR